ncbi:hypothetical protein ATANTOWER_018445, partial [Ataeniobius toweri]|nr:hypothetical protein [Ataeniobius toweri]
MLANCHGGSLLQVYFTQAEDFLSVLEQQKKNRADFTQKSSILCSAAMNVIPSVIRGARRLFHSDLPLLLFPVRSSAPLLTWPQSRRFASKQVKGQKKEQKKQNPNPKMDKQEVEIRQGMTAEALAAAMNKDF